jgi:hypothetical protein
MTELFEDRRAATTETMVPAGPAPADAVLVHNHVRHTVRTISGMRGFCAWWGDPDPRYVVCDCGWRPELGNHYAVEARR